MTAPLNAEDMLSFDLNDAERRFLTAGYAALGGPAHVTKEMAVAMGFQGLSDLETQATRICRLLWEHQPMSRLDWARSLLWATLCSTDSPMGCAADWKFIAHMADEEASATRRSLQNKLTRDIRPIVGNGLGTA